MPDLHITKKDASADAKYKITNRTPRICLQFVRGTKLAVQREMKLLRTQLMLHSPNDLIH